MEYVSRIYHASAMQTLQLLLESLHKHASNKATTKLPVSVLLPDFLAG